MLTVDAHQLIRTFFLEIKGLTTAAFQRVAFMLANISAH